MHTRSKHCPTSRSLPDVPNVLYHVFSYLDPIHQFDEEQAYECRRSLTLAARTCRGFTSPALDILWRRLPDDQPLADLLCEVGIATKEAHETALEVLGENRPRRYWLPNQGGASVGLSGEYERCWKLLRGYDIQYHLRDIGDPRKYPGWTRFMEYASRVRSMSLFAFDGPAWCRIWEELRTRIDGTPILPKLLTVAFCNISTEPLAPASLALISRSVRKLNFNLEDEDAVSAFQERLRCLFSQTFKFAPEIDELRLQLHPSVLDRSLMQAQCSRLRHLEVVPQVDLEDLRILSELPALQHLSISLPREYFPEARSSPAFISVATLAVAGTWASLGAFLATTRLPLMHTLSITGWDYGERAAELAQACVQCFHTLAARHPSLTRLAVSATAGYVPPSQNGIVGCILLVPDALKAALLDIVRPLLALSALRHLDLEFPSYFDIACTDADLRAVAEAFPALEALHLRVWPYFSLGIQHSPERPRGGQLDALVHFARNCPRLHLLHLPAMMLAEAESGAQTVLVDSEGHRGESAHGLRTLVIPKVLLPPGRTDLAGKVSEVMRGVFPLVASPFREERLAIEGDWAVADGASRCPECTIGSRLTFL